MTRNDYPIIDYTISGGVNTGIRYNSSFEQMEACVAAGLDPYLWETGEYPPKFQARIVAWYRIRSLIEQHSNDAVARDMKRRRKKKR